MRYKHRLEIKIIFLEVSLWNANKTIVLKTQISGRIWANIFSVFLFVTPSNIYVL